MNLFDNTTPVLKQALADLIAEQILNGLNKKPFEQWYNTAFDAYLCDEEFCPTKDEILKKIKELFKLN